MSAKSKSITKSKISPKSNSEFDKVSKKLKSVIESSDDSDDTKKFKRLLNLYMENLTKFPENSNPEFEVRFGTKNIKSITKIDFANVAKSLLANGFKLVKENYSLKIIMDNEYSQIRTQLNGLNNIQDYCNNNTIDKIVDPANLSFLQKEYFKFEEQPIYPLDFDDYNFRVSFQVENNFDIVDEKIQKIINKWSSTKKIFRYIKRFEYSHPLIPFMIHLSIVKTSKSLGGKMIPQFNIKDSEVFDSVEHYEIEIECNNTQIGIDTKFETGIYLYGLLKKTIKYILIGLQQTKYPVTISEQSNILNNYYKLIKGPEFDKSKHSKINFKDFVGPSSTTLQMINLINIDDINNATKAIGNIRNNYTVTDKADGMRKLLYINNDGKIYLLTTSMNIEFTGCFTGVKELFNSLIDGEHILHDKNGQFINLFAAFDIYYLNGKNVTMLPFIDVSTAAKQKKEIKEGKDKLAKDDELEDELDDDPPSKVGKDEKTKEEAAKFRLVILNSIIKKLNIQFILQDSKAKIPFTIKIKKFYAQNIFSGCATILNNIEKGLYDYNTDGLIFTPANSGVASKKTGELAPNYKITWTESFKWKPPQYNTIDFLVKFKKNEFKKNIISNLHSEGISLTGANDYKQYYTLILHVGFDESKHGYINPFNDVINDYLPSTLNKDSYSSNYKPMQFYPTNPSDNNAGICNILGTPDNENNLKIYTLEHEEIEDYSIVEFSYDSTKPEFWRWTPLRVRYDKTSELRAGAKNFGNAYHVANSNWQSIHNPISEEIIKTGNGVILDNGDDDIYYNKVSNKTQTRGLRDFHNLYVKNILINNTLQPGQTLIDYACGKGGDLPKWINANLAFILGIDLSKDNIENRMDGACARYLNYCYKFTNVPKALFLNGNSSINIKSGEALFTEKSKAIVKAIFGEGTKNEITLGKGVYKNYGIAKNGFNVSSIQFALHYMFESEAIAHSFLKNVAQCTAINGYFIGGCYDGKRVFNMLETLETGESKSLFKNETKIWEITKRYNNSEFNDDESCLGYAIDVFQESINKTFREYLVNFDYLVRLMENYGFVLLNQSEYKQLELPGSLGSFEEMYKFMNSEIQRKPSLKFKIGNSLIMSEEEKKISFLNNYFVFKKVRAIDEAAIEEKIKFQTENLEQSQKVVEELEALDEELLKQEKKSIEEKSKKLAQQFLEKKEKEQIEEDALSELMSPLVMEDKIEPGKTLKKDLAKMKLTIDEKIALAEAKKKAKEEEKKKLKDEKIKAKEKAKLEKKEKLESQSKK